MNDATALFKPEASPFSGKVFLSVYIGAVGLTPVVYCLTDFGKDIISFGREAGNDIVLNSTYVSRKHGRFVRAQGGFFIEDNNSTNGLFVNGVKKARHFVCENDIVRIDDSSRNSEKGVLLVFYTGTDGAPWKEYRFKPEDIEIKIGRGDSCDIKLEHISVSKVHAIIRKRDGAYFLCDNDSTNGITVNGVRITRHPYMLHEKDLIVITNSQLTFSAGGVSYCCYRKGVSLAAEGIIKKVKVKKKLLSGEGLRPSEKIICNNVSLTIKPGEIVAIIGGSGAGKTTVMNCLSGYSCPAAGNVLVNNVDLYKNFNTLKNIIGYVPQSDIVHENLSVFDMLLYAARLRLPKDTSKEEILEIVNNAIEMVKLTAHKETLIKELSGGQRKRASIAVELLSDPNLFFLDEPSSGLDPGTEYSLMETLKNMTAGGKTVVFVTHSTLVLESCDKIIFMGNGGNLCFIGNYSEALRFFKVPDIVSIYDLLSDEKTSVYWKRQYLESIKHEKKKADKSEASSVVLRKAFVKQIFVMLQRNIRLLINDRVRLYLILLQAPLLAFLISFVADDNQYKAYGITRSLLFALSCSAFWMGILNSIQEICKEKIILKREYMTGTRLDAYISSKMLTMTLLCLVQSFLLSSVFSWRIGLPEQGVLFNNAYWELFATSFLTSLSASAMGIFVSSLFKNADRAMTIAPLLLMPQLLFSGLIFELSGVSEGISFLAVCRWAMEGLGTTANLNALDLITKQGVVMPREMESFYDFTQSHMLTVWAILFSFVIVFSILSGFILKRINDKAQ
jgi:ABC-type multidrug transport system ATPase subunit/pSer/pThr/pTyr-binding forkhead associated (FHA) protein